jgi:hypothetical protein
VPPAADEPQLRQRFEKEAPPAWQAYLEHMKRLQGTVERTMTDRKPTQMSMRFSHELKQAPGSLYFFEQFYEPDVGADPGVSYFKRGSIEVTNPLYSFELRREDDKSAWIVSRIDTSPQHQQSFTPPRRLRGIVRLPISMGWIFDGPPPGPGVPGFVLQDVSSVERDGKDLVKVSFIYRPTDLTSPRTPELFAGWVLLDPKHFWVLVEQQIQWKRPVLSEPRTSAATYEYRLVDGNVPILTGSRLVASDSSYESETISNYQLRLADLSPSEFQLSAFGFSEPPIAQRAFPWSIVVLIVGAACAAGGLLWWWRARPKVAH